MSGDVIDNPAGDEKDPLLSDDEKDALMAGVTAGVVGNESDNSGLLDIRPFELRPDAYINYGSYPRLQHICQEMSKRLASLWSALLRGPVSITAEETYAAVYGEATKELPAPVITTLVAMAPLPGHAVVIVDNDLLRLLVEMFFGHAFEAVDAEQSANAKVRQQFTAGELRVCDLAMQRALQVVAPAWEKTVAVNATQKAREFDPTVGVGLLPKDEVVICRFVVQTDASRGVLHWILPFSQIASIADELEGAENARADAGDPHWRECISARLCDTSIETAVMVGSIRLPLRRVVSFRAGETLPLDDPELASLFVHGERRALGRFGTHNNHNAFRLTEWLP